MRESQAITLASATADAEAIARSLREIASATDGRSSGALEYLADEADFLAARLRRISEEEGMTHIIRKADHDPGPAWPWVYRHMRIRAGAAERHESRVTATVDAARTAARLIVGDPADAVNRTAQILIELDLGGIGGVLGFLGHSEDSTGATVRMPPFAELGTGRWQAGDGQAYRAAAMDAAREVGIHPMPSPTEVRSIATRCPGEWLEWVWAYCMRRIYIAQTPAEAREWRQIALACAEREDAPESVRRLSGELDLPVGDDELR